MNNEYLGISSANHFGALYARIRLISLDVALGALGGGLFARTICDSGMPWAWYMILPLAVWLIYTLDHLLDARRLGESAHTPRHLFHFRYFKVLATVWLILALVCGVLAICFLSSSGILFGLGLGTFVLLHLYLVKRVGEKTSPWLIKEMGVALIYASGVWGLPLLFHFQQTGPVFPFQSGFSMVIIFGQFCLLALINLLEFSLFESESDRIDKQTSFVLAIGKEKAANLIALLLGLGFITGIGLSLFEPSLLMFKIQIVYLLMGLILAALLQQEKLFLPHERYRAWGDAAFLIPALFPLM